MITSFTVGETQSEHAMVLRRPESQRSTVEGFFLRDVRRCESTERFAVSHMIILPCCTSSGVAPLVPESLFSGSATLPHHKPLMMHADFDVELSRRSPRRAPR